MLIVQISNFIMCHHFVNEKQLIDHHVVPTPVAVPIDQNLPVRVGSLRVGTRRRGRFVNLSVRVANNSGRNRKGEDEEAPRVKLKFFNCAVDEATIVHAVIGNVRPKMREINTIFLRGQVIIIVESLVLSVSLLG